MKTKLRAGEDIDFLTAAELDEVISRHLSGFLRPPQTERPRQTIALDASGNSGQITEQNAIYQVPVGFTFHVHRIEVSADGYTLGAPYTNATGYLEVLQNGRWRDGFPFTGGYSLPAVWSAGDEDAIEYRNGERVGIRVYGGPASGHIIVQVQGTLQPDVIQ